MKLFGFLSLKLCKHEFCIDDIKLTGIPRLPKPKHGDGYQEWKVYLQAIYTHDSHTKRVKCNCDKCGELHYADCGLHLKGKLIRRVKG